MTESAAQKKNRTIFLIAGLVVGSIIVAAVIMSTRTNQSTTDDAPEPNTTTVDSTPSVDPYAYEENLPELGSMTLLQNDLDTTSYSIALNEAVDQAKGLTIIVTTDEPIFTDSESDSVFSLAKLDGWTQLYNKQTTKTPSGASSARAGFITLLPDGIQLSAGTLATLKTQLPITSNVEAVIVINKNSAETLKGKIVFTE